MNISKYCEFLLEEKVSSKTGKPYYCISVRFDTFTYPLVFLTKDRYDIMVQSLSK